MHTDCILFMPGLFYIRNYVKNIENLGIDNKIYSNKLLDAFSSDIFVLKDLKNRSFVFYMFCKNEKSSVICH